MKKVKLEILKPGRIFVTKNGAIIHLSSKQTEHNEDIAEELINSKVAILFDSKKNNTSDSKKIKELESELEKTKEENSKEIKESDDKIKELELQLEKIKQEIQITSEKTKK